MYIWWESDATLATLKYFHPIYSNSSVDSLGPTFASWPIGLLHFGASLVLNPSVIPPFSLRWFSQGGYILLPYLEMIFQFVQKKKKRKRQKIWGSMCSTWSSNKPLCTSPWKCNTHWSLLHGFMVWSTSKVFHNRKPKFWVLWRRADLFEYNCWT